MKTVTVKNSLGESYELPKILHMPRAVYSAYNDLLKQEFEIEKIKPELKTQDGQLRNAQKIFDYNEFNQALWDAMDAYLPGWKDFSQSMSMVEMKKVVLAIRVTENDAELVHEETDFLELP